MQHASRGRVAFQMFNYAFLAIVSLLCILPLVHILAISFSSSTAVSAGEVTFWPVDFTLKSYSFILDNPRFLDSLWVTVQRVVLGTAIGIFLTVLTAYPLSKPTSAFRHRSVFAWFFVFTILFNGGLIPWYMTVKMTGLINSLWALVLPSAVAVFHIILLLNFYRSLPKELEEAAHVDGAGHWVILWKVMVPLSKPAIATILLFTVVQHWNSWFDGMILMNKPSDYPLATYLQSVIIKLDFENLRQEDIYMLGIISDRTSKAAQIFLGTLPILLVYPFLQKYFMKGIVMGSVKG
ncbi:carbohydrate ABC transporter permease [Paenibacillus sp. J5C_2022]|uniref:carbohydrate ABC transporter permease n=1 Tax=Paenibacillus sp. J5C2022 TaxID=2977129 RepID=UPI0021D1130B|nr:carbohydrate ABC transporter permease [Paenibacillus sp. J5C2022]MCU6708069.1 carbohydrate ABC transporter permease [Paenibacillus sp. J5C2022]